MGNRSSCDSKDKEKKLLGSGAFGVVRLADIPEHGKVALKVAKNRYQKRWMESEATLQMAAEHDHVVKVYGLLSPVGLLEIAMEYMEGGNLQNLLLDRKRALSYRKRHDMCYDIALGLDHLHNLPCGGCIIHNDIKPDNILLTADLRCKIADFGCSKWYDIEGKCVDGCPEDLFCILYAAPEKLRHHLLPFTDADHQRQQYHTITHHLIDREPQACSVQDDKDKYQPHESSDIYSLGMVVHMLLYRTLPWHGNLVGCLSQVLKGRRPDTPRMYAPKPDMRSARVLVSVMFKCWKQSYFNRPTSRQVCLELQGLPS